MWTGNETSRILAFCQSPFFLSVVTIHPQINKSDDIVTIDQLD